MHNTAISVCVLAFLPLGDLRCECVYIYINGFIRTVIQEFSYRAMAYNDKALPGCACWMPVIFYWLAEVPSKVLT
uniref:Putative secreted protein ovary overexpressed n=1 Tax=Rhipicephalus microplus TaxID=6941 RepID=A0A6M2DET0_RHIMP